MGRRCQGTTVALATQRSLRAGRIYFLTARRRLSARLWWEAEKPRRGKARPHPRSRRQLSSLSFPTAFVSHRSWACGHPQFRFRGVSEGAARNTYGLSKPPSSPTVARATVAAAVRAAPGLHWEHGSAAAVRCRNAGLLPDSFRPRGHGRSPGLTLGSTARASGAQLRVVRAAGPGHRLRSPGSGGPDAPASAAAAAPGSFATVPAEQAAGLQSRRPER